MDKALHTTHVGTTSHGLPHVKQNLHATAGQSHSGTTGRTVGEVKSEEKEEKSGANLPYRPSDHARLYNFAEEIQRAVSNR